MQRPSVDLPQPDSPTRPSASPRATVRSTPSTARRTSIGSFRRRWTSESLSGKCMARLRTSSKGVAASGTRAQLFVIATGGCALRAEGDERRVDARTVGTGDLAAGVEATARGRRDEVGRHADDRLEVRTPLV